MGKHTNDDFVSLDPSSTVPEDMILTVTVADIRGYHETSNSLAQVLCSFAKTPQYAAPLLIILNADFTRRRCSWKTCAVSSAAIYISLSHLVLAQELQDLQDTVDNNAQVLIAASLRNFFFFWGLFCTQEPLLKTADAFYS